MMEQARQETRRQASTREFASIGIQRSLLVGPLPCQTSKRETTQSTFKQYCGMPECKETMS